MAFEGFYCFGPGMWKLFGNEAGLYVGCLSTCHHVVLNCVGFVMLQGFVWHLFLILILHRYWSIWQYLLALIVLCDLQSKHLTVSVVLCDLQSRSRRPFMPSCVFYLDGFTIWYSVIKHCCCLNSTSHWHIQLFCCIKALQCVCWVQHPVGSSALLHRLYVPLILWTWCQHRSRVLL